VLSSSVEETGVDSGLYAACAGLIARSQALDLVANNLANVNTAGFRGQETTFQTQLASQLGATPSMLNLAVNDYGVLGGSRLDFAQGQIERTGNPFDLAIEGPGFFAVQTPGGVMYTRNGNFRVSAQGQLITSDGNPVLGDEGPVRVPPGDISISADGTLSANGALAGKLRLVEFPSGTPLVSAGESLYSAPTAAARPASASRIQQGMLESSNVNAIASAVGLIGLQRNAESLQRAMSLFHTELNRAAVEDLPRV